MKRYLFVFCLIFGTCGVAFAGGKNNVAAYLTQWGGGKFTSCQGHALVGSEACIGQSAKDNCEAKKMYARDYTDEYALQMMIALTVNERGAYFCPIQIEGKNKNKGNAWTEYAQISTAGCVWLCREGYTGVTCDKTQDQVDSCDFEPLRRENYASLERVATGANMEERVAMFVFNKKQKCGVSKTQEHDVVLGIVKWTASGHGAWVQPLEVRAQRDGWGDMKSWAAIVPLAQSSEMLVCKNGYKPNGQDCVEIDTQVCMLQKMCDGWGAFDETIHRLEPVTKNGETCYQYKCKEAGKAFVSAQLRTCEECPSDLFTGIASSGECVRCEKGKFFSLKAAGNCGDATAYTKLDLQYGKGKTKTTAGELKKQCWYYSNPEDYKNCVEQGEAFVPPENSGE